MLIVVSFLLIFFFRDFSICCEILGGFFNLFLLFLVNSRNSCFASSDLRLCIVLN